LGISWRGEGGARRFDEEGRKACRDRTFAHTGRRRLDGIHFEAGEHRKIGVAVAAKVREMLG